jgi:hypothetical protein
MWVSCVCVFWTTPGRAELATLRAVISLHNFSTTGIEQMKTKTTLAALLLAAVMVTPSYGD